MSLRRLLLPTLAALAVLLLVAAGPAAAGPTPPAVVAAQTAARTTTGSIAANDPSLPPLRIQPYDHCSDTDGRPFATGLPPLPCLPYVGNQVTPNRYQDFGGVYDDSSTVVAKPRLTLALPLTVGRTFYTICVRGRTGSPCPAGSGITFPPGQVGSFFYAVYASVYLQSPLGSTQQFGLFAPVHQALYAFGSLPATATVSIRQRSSAGVVEPLRLTWLSSGIVPQGTVIPTYEQFGPAPFAPTSQLIPAPHVAGPVDIVVSDVRVDGIPLDVGTACHTSTTLDLTAPGGWIDAASEAPPVPGRPGAFRPLSPVKSYLTADVDIPAFTDCVSAGGEDVSPLVTGLVSGPHDTLDVTQDQELRNFGCLPATSDPDTCQYDHPPTVDPRSIRPSP